MATTYLTLTNSVLRELNETELTSSTFSSSRGIQTAVKDFINKGIHDIYNETGEIPLLYSRTTQDLTIGDNEYSFLNLLIQHYHIVIPYFQIVLLRILKILQFKTVLN